MLLHGFAQDRTVWDEVRGHLLRVRTIIAPDLRGHGDAAGLRPIDQAVLAADLSDLTSALGPITLVGYSMGARLALQWASDHPDRVSSLLLISPSAGIEDAAERSSRRKADLLLAADLRRHGIEWFAEHWGALPMWDGEPPAVARKAHDLRLRQDPDGLAAALEGFGQGVWSSHWGSLEELGARTRLLVGQRDHQCNRRARAMAKRIPSAEIRVVSGAGHSLLLESPTAVSESIDDL